MGVCGSDGHYYERGRIGPYVVEAPLILGHESAGRVAVIGPEVTKQAVGDRVEPGCPAARRIARAREPINTMRSSGRVHRRDPMPVGHHSGEPALAEELREMHAAVIPGYHLNKRHWNTVIMDGSLSDQTLRDMIEDSYDLVVSKLPRARRLGLGWHSDP